MSTRRRNMEPGAVRVTRWWYTRGNTILGTWCAVYENEDTPPHVVAIESHWWYVAAPFFMHSLMHYGFERRTILPHC